MNEVPPGRDESDDADDLYRRASALDESRPSELVRRRVLDHGAQLAAERAAKNAAPGIASARGANRTWRRRRPAIFGTLAAAALAGLLITPRFFTPSVPPSALSSAPPSAQPGALSTALPSAPPGAPPSAPPMATISASPPAADSRNQDAANRIAAPAAEFAAKNSPAKTQNMAAARSRSVASDASQAGAPAQPMASLAEAGRSSDPAAELRRAAEIGDLPEMQTLLDRQPLIEARDENGRTALMLAAVHGQSQAVDVLLAHGADPNAADGHGTTPLQAAVAGNQQAIAAALRRAGAR